MNVNELRIGNWVTINNKIAWNEYKHIAMKVTAIETKQDKQFIKSDGSISVESTYLRRSFSQFSEFIKPILLTETLLIKSGFELYYESQFCKRYELILNTEICYSFSNLEDYRGSVGFSYVGKVIQNIKFVHQLQNLYFALTGQELTIEL